jgi:hypothetical protein
MATRHAADEADIRRRIGELVAAISAMDLDGVKLAYAPDMVSFDIEPPLQHVGAAAKWHNWEGFFSPDRVSGDGRGNRVRAGSGVPGHHPPGADAGPAEDPAENHRDHGPGRHRREADGSASAEQDPAAAALARA